jgi:hypothetical protein
MTGSRGWPDADAKHLTMQMRRIVKTQLLSSNVGWFVPNLNPIHVTIQNQIHEDL